MDDRRRQCMDSSISLSIKFLTYPWSKGERRRLCGGSGGQCRSTNINMVQEASATSKFCFMVSGFCFIKVLGSLVRYMYNITSDPKTILIHIDSSDNWFSFYFCFFFFL